MLGFNPNENLRFVYLATLLALVIVFGLRGRNLSATVRQGGAWLLIFVVVLTVYAYREPLIRFAGPVVQVLSPSRVIEVASDNGERELSVGRGSDGHFRVDAEVDGTTVRFLVDTGASGTVLTQRDAQRAGIDIASLSYDTPVDTANGTAFYATARIASLAIGPYRMSDVGVAVAPQNALSGSLLGMSVIGRFRGWRVEGDRLLLSP